MSNLNTAQRNALLGSAFADPQGRRFPILDQDDVDSAKYLIGKARNPDAVKRRVMMLARKKGPRIPDAWRDDPNKASGSSHVAGY